jgi:hypothetical protein
MMAGGDRRPDLADLRIPTVILHGQQDPLIRPDGGRATADTIPGAELVLLPGMGHDPPKPLWPVSSNRSGMSPIGLERSAYPDGPI